MEACPPEILLTIFTMACIDGGATGCSLALVSKYISSLSSTVQLHSIALHSLAQMRLFLDTLQRRPPELRRIRHLLLSESKPHLHVQRMADTDTRIGITEAYAAIITLVGPGLTTLSVSLRDHVPFTALAPLGVDLGNLRDLAVQCQDFMASPVLPSDPIPSSLDKRFPGLRRLSLWGMQAAHPYWPMPLFNAVTAAGPALLELRLHSEAVWKFPEALHEALRPGSDTSQRVHNLPEGLQRIVLLPDNRRALNGPGGEWPNFGLNRRMMLDFEVLATADARVVIVPETSYSDGDCLDDWLDMVAGGEGCWKLPPSISKDTSRAD